MFSTLPVQNPADQLSSLVSAPSRLACQVLARSQGDLLSNLGSIPSVSAVSHMPLGGFAFAPTVPHQMTARGHASQISIVANKNHGIRSATPEVITCQQSDGLSLQPCLNAISACSQSNRPIEQQPKRNGQGPEMSKSSTHSQTSGSAQHCIDCFQHVLTAAKQHSPVLAPQTHAHKQVCQTISLQGIGTWVNSHTDQQCSPAENPGSSSLLAAQPHELAMLVIQRKVHQGADLAVPWKSNAWVFQDQEELSHYHDQDYIDTCRNGVDIGYQGPHHLQVSDNWPSAYKLPEITEKTITKDFFRGQRLVHSTNCHLTFVMWCPL